MIKYLNNSKDKDVKASLYRYLFKYIIIHLFIYLFIY